MSFKDKFKSLIGIDDEEFFEEEFHMPVMEAPKPVAPAPVARPEQQPVKPLRAVETPKQINKDQVATMNENLMSKVIIREPKDYSDAQNIADCLKENLPVFINLQRLDKGQGRRVIDFLSGTIYAVDGEIKRVGNDLFLCTPNNVETDGTVTESQDELSLGELYN